MSRKSAVFLLVLLCAVLAGYAQSTRKPLKEALSFLQKEKKTRFVFERAVVEGLTVEYNWDEVRNKEVQQVLNDLLTQVNLYALPVGSNYYAVKRNRAKAAPAIPKRTSGGEDSASHSGRDTLPGSNTGHTTTIAGGIYEKNSGRPLEAASVQLQPYGYYAITGSDGRFLFRNVPVGRINLVVSSMSMIAQETQITLTQAPALNLRIELSTNALSLQEVQVVARENRQGATASRISKTAIEHLQATSLSDVLQLLPGGLARNPDMSGVNQFALRQVNSDNVGSLGTALLVNGAPISNNANMQVTNTATAGANASFATSSGGGVDLRQFSADNIESIEVIRGIPSVEYGDLTSGALIVNRKAGEQPFNIKARINPRITQLYTGKGFDLGGKRGTLYADLEYTRSYDDQRFEYRGYHRLSGYVIYSKKFGGARPFYTNTDLSYSRNLDEQKLDPDDKRYQYVREAKDLSYRFNTNGRWELHKKFAHQVQYNLSVNHSVQKSFQQQLLSGYIYPLSFHLKDTTAPGQFVPSEYTSQLWVEGKPLSIFARISNMFFLRGERLNHRVLMGAEWKTDANSGQGKTYDLTRPPQMLSGNASRPRAYSDIPSLHQLSFYLEDNMNARIFGKRMNLQAGIRFDNVQPSGIWTTNKGTVAAPRFNWSYEVLKDLSLRAGWGITAKAPTLLYLYPQNAYYDLMNYNLYAENPAERLVLITTRSFNTENPELKIMKTTKREAGFDWSFAPRKRLTVTAFHEKTRNGYGFEVAPWSVSLVPLPIYQASSRPPGQPPVLDPDPIRIDTFIADYNVPLNNRINTNRGVEFDLDLGRFNTIRTSFVVNGAWIRSTSVNSNVYISKKQVNGADPTRIALYDQGRGTESERFNSTLRMIHNIPELRFLVTMSVQTIWWEKTKAVGYDSIPIAYINRGNGNTYYFSKEERASITRANRDLFETFSDGYFNTEKWNPLWLFNLRLTKEIGKNIGFSFFANNVFSNRKLEQSTRYPTQFTRRNPELFFGTEINIKL